MSFFNYIPECDRNAPLFSQPNCLYHENNDTGILQPISVVLMFK